jgi:predicted AlkP superfamily phosphohydrolase/phosphomutase
LGDNVSVKFVCNQRYKTQLNDEKKKLVQKMMELKGDKDMTMLNQVFEPDKLYGTAMGDKPDLMVYFDELNWRSAGTVGHDSIYLSENDTGPDDSVHSMDGIFLMFNPQRNMNSSIIEGAKVEDIAPTLLKLFGVDGGLRAECDGIDGRVLEKVVAAVG